MAHFALLLFQKNRGSILGFGTIATLAICPHDQLTWQNFVGKPYDTVCMISSVLLRLARTSQSSQCFVTPLWAQAAMFWFLSEGHGNLRDYRLKLQVARGIKIYHHKISSYMKCRKTTRRLTRSPDSGKIPTPKPQRDFHSPGQAKAFWCIAWISQIAMFHKKHGLFEIIMLYPYKIFRALFFGERMIMVMSSCNVRGSLSACPASRTKLTTQSVGSLDTSSWTILCLAWQALRDGIRIALGNNCV